MVKHYDTSVELCGVKLTNPVIPASGTFGFGREFAEYYDLDCLGAIRLRVLRAMPALVTPHPVLRSVHRVLSTR